MLGIMEDMVDCMSEYYDKVDHLERGFILHGVNDESREWLEDALLMTDAMMTVWGRSGLHCSRHAHNLGTGRGRAELILHRGDISTAVGEAIRMVMLSYESKPEPCEGEMADSRGRAPKHVSAWHRTPSSHYPSLRDVRSEALNSLFHWRAIDPLLRMVRFHEDTVRELLPAMRVFTENLTIVGEGDEAKVMLTTATRKHTGMVGFEPAETLGMPDTPEGIATICAYRHLVVSPILSTSILSVDSKDDNPVDAALIGLIPPCYITGDNNYGIPWMPVKHPQRRAAMLASLMNPAFLTGMAPRITQYEDGTFLYDLPIALHALAMDESEDDAVGTGVEGLQEREREYSRLDPGKVRDAAMGCMTRMDTLPLMRESTWERILNMRNWDGEPMSSKVLRFIGRVNTPIDQERKHMNQCVGQNCVPVINSPDAADLIVDVWQRCADGKSGCDSGRLLDALFSAEKTPTSSGSLADRALRMNEDGIAGIARRAYVRNEPDRVEAAACMEYARSMIADSDSLTALADAHRVDIIQYCDAVENAGQAMPKQFVSETLKSAATL